MQYAGAEMGFLTLVRRVIYGSEESFAALAVWFGAEATFTPLAARFGAELSFLTGGLPGVNEEMFVTEATG
jgi:hypothetical protein